MELAFPKMPAEFRDDGVVGSEVLVALKRIPNLALVVLEYWRNDYRCRAKIV